MVPRCAYYLNESYDVIRHIVLINWDLGFDREAKHQYIMRLTEALNKPDMIIVDITTASYIYEARMLSPVFVKLKNDPSITVEDYLQQIHLFNNPQFSEDTRVKLSGYIYMTNLSDRNKSVIAKYDGFFDVFGNPIKAPHNTQALFATLYKKLMLQHKEDILSDYDTYVDWFDSLNIIDVTE